MNDLDLLGKDLPQYKRIDGPWIGLLALGIFISLATLIAIPVLYFCWRRYQQTNQTEDTSEILDNKPTDQRQIPIQIDDQPRNFYGTQVNIHSMTSREKERFFSSST